MSDLPRVCLVSASGQNVFFAEILEAFGEALRARGVVVEEAVDCFPAAAEDLVYLFIPHEYVTLVHQLAYPTATQLGRSVAICTEQPGTGWFESACAFAAEAGAAVDINPLGREELRRRGIAAGHVPLGYVPAWDAWKGEEVRERSTDLVFLGGHVERRARAIAACIGALAGRRSAIHLTESVRPHTDANQAFLSRGRKWRLLADSRVILNVHRNTLPYMEWHRVIGALLNGCVLLSEHSLGVEPLVPGEHFVSARYEDLPDVLEGMLADPGRVERIRHAAYDLVCEQMSLDRTADGLVAAIESASRNPLAAGSERTQPAAPPLPLPPPLREPGWQTDADAAGDLAPLRTGLKHLVVEMRGVKRQLAELRSSGQPEEELVEQLGPLCSSPRVSVLLTVYNYADFVGDALRSVALSDIDGIEVIAVDDASTDDSVEAVRTACAELPWLSVKHVCRQRNHGLPAARNLALAHSSADLLFVLDADNMVLPAGLGLLAQALDADAGASFAYGITECFDAQGPVGLMNWLDWDPARLRHGNYIDAMAMMRREALEAMGGYSTDSALYGWEDFDLWVGMAAKGMRGIRVPDFVARYRRNVHSMISLANVDSQFTWSALLRRHPALARPVAGRPDAALRARP